jgi:hypothetical protein
MHDTLTRRPGTALTAPTRNRYFYGKLLDADHLELEQRYFLDMSRLVNRLTLGWGVLCGLAVTAVEGAVRVSPGVAIDGRGREIVVTDPITVADPWALTDDCSRPTGDRQEGGPVVICLAYHECDVDPAPVLVSDCEVREECVPGAVRERYRLVVRKPSDHDALADPCSTFTGASDSGPWTSGRWTNVSHADAVAALNARMLEVGVVAGGEPGTDGLRERLCAAFQPSCAPGPDCVPLAILVMSGGAIVPLPCAIRRTIYSNAVLLDLILCLAKHVDDCCERRVTTTAPVVNAIFPAPGSKLAAGELRDSTVDPEGGIAITFDRKMRDDRLNAPDEWLRVIAFLPPSADDTTHPEVGPSAGHLAGSLAVPVSFVGPQEETAEGFRALYRFEPVRLAGTDPVSILSVPQARFVVIVRSDDVTQIVDTSDPPELLDADYRGTGLDTPTLELLWSLPAQLVSLVRGVVDAIPRPPADIPPLPKSGNGIEGGVFHSYFDVST